MIPTPAPIHFLYAFLLAALVAYFAYKKGSLSRSGMFAAWALGTLVMGFGMQLGGPATLLGFFISASWLSRRAKASRPAAGEQAAKGGPRDAWQVLANGGLAGLGYTLAGLTRQPVFILAAVGSLAAANADTWATELGAFSKAKPRLITTFKPVERGRSGAVSFLGLLGAAAGALLIAFLYVLTTTYYPQPVKLMGIITLSGFIGSLVDSLLGATLQAIYTCPVCETSTEKHPLHTCGTPSQFQKGLPWLNNDWVNFICTLTGAVLTAALYLL